MKKQIRIGIVVALILAVVAVTITYGNAILIHVAPKAVLVSAVPKLYAQLEERFAESPLWILAQNYDPEGKYTARIMLEKSNNLTGNIQYNMLVQSALEKHMLYGAGTIQTADQAVDLSFYADGTFAAVSSSSLLQGVYYGITYDTFREDIRSIPLSTLLISDSKLEIWDESVQGVRQFMQRDYPDLSIPSVSPKELYAIAFAAATKDWETEKTTLVVGDETLECVRLSFSIPAEQWADNFGQITGALYPADTEPNLEVYLYQSTIVKLRILFSGKDFSESYSILFGKEPKSNPIVLELGDGSAQPDTRTSIRIATSWKDGHYLESWDYQTVARKGRAAIDWLYTSGTIHLDAGDCSAVCKVEETADGFRITTEDAADLIQAVIQQEKVQSLLSGASGCMEICRGARIATPEYRNVDQWSATDLTQLLERAARLMILPSF